MRELYNDLPCVYFASDADNVILEANSTLSQYLGYTADELIGQKLEKIFTLSTRIFQQTHFFPLLQMKGIAEEIYITLKCNNGEELPVLINAVRQTEGEIHLTRFAGITVTKRKKFEDEIIAAKKAAETALAENTTLKAIREELQKYAEELDIQIAIANKQNHELKQFNHLATHSLQEPMRKIFFYSIEIVRNHDQEKVAIAVQKIRKAADDLNAKLQGLQQYVWLTNEQLDFVQVNVNSFLQSEIEQLQLNNDGIEINLEAENIPAIEANAAQLRYLLKELLSNAVRFRKAGNCVSLKVFYSTLLLNKFKQLNGKYKYADYIKIQLQDDGIGFDDNFQDQAFDFFRKLRPSPISGVGIGLSLCKKIAENHNGFITLESINESGTTVNLFLPTKQEITVS